MRILNYFVPIEIVYILVIIFSVLSISSLVFWLISLKKKSAFLTELITRVNSWWKITIGVAIVIVAPAYIGTILLAYISFVALRELFSIGRIRSSDRVALMVAYFSIPVQYYLAYNYYFEPFLYFIPLVM